MPIPNHGPCCQSLLYPTSCWHCRKSIHVLQCSCGSAVLLDGVGGLWPRHTCLGKGGTVGIGDSGLSGWAAVDALRALGAPISHDVMHKIFPVEQQSKYPNVQLPADIESVEPKIGQAMNFPAVVRELHASTQRTSAIEDLSAMGMGLLGLDPKERYCQITLVRNNIRPNQSYTAIVSENLVQGLKTGVMVTARMSAKIQANFNCWIVSDINLL